MRNGRSAEEELDAPAEPMQGSDDSSTPERGSGKRAFLPSSMGLSILVDPETERLDVALSWGDYVPESGAAAEAGGAGRTEAGGDGDDAASRRRFAPWVRRPRAEKVAIDLSTTRVGTPVAHEVPGSGGLELVCPVRRTRVRTFDGDRDARAVALFVVNRRPPAKDDDLQDTAFAFQVEMRVEADRVLVPRYDPRGLDGDDWDERLADLHYHDVTEYAESRRLVRKCSPVQLIGSAYPNRRPHPTAPTRTSALLNGAGRDGMVSVCWRARSRILKCGVVSGRSAKGGGDVNVMYRRHV